MGKTKIFTNFQNITTYYSLKLVVGESWIHTVPVGLTEGTLGLRLPNGVRVLRDCLTGLGLLAGAGGFGRLGLSTVHTTVGGTRYSTIATRRTPPSNTLAGSLTGGPSCWTSWRSWVTSARRASIFA
jgi:hypothetical protein